MQEYIFVQTGPKYAVWRIEDERPILVRMLVWVKWLEPYENSNICWSAEPLAHLTNVNEDTLNQVLEETRVWPWPRSNTNEIERQKEEILKCYFYSIK